MRRLLQLRQLPPALQLRELRQLPQINGTRTETLRKGFALPRPIPNVKKS